MIVGAAGAVVFQLAVVDAVIFSPYEGIPIHSGPPYEMPPYGRFSPLCADIVPLVGPYVLLCYDMSCDVLSWYVVLCNVMERILSCVGMLCYAVFCLM